MDFTGARWRTSSYSGKNGNSTGCVEVAFLTGAHWRTSSHSGGHDGNGCVEVAFVPGVRVPEVRVAVRDSKDRSLPAQLYPAAGWAAFLAGVRAGDFPAL